MRRVYPDINKILSYRHKKLILWVDARSSFSTISDIDISSAGYYREYYDLINWDFITTKKIPAIRFSYCELSKKGKKILSKIKI